jgi:hypothetical protein
MAEMVIITAAEYQALLGAATNLADLREHDRAMAAIARGDQELIPEAFAKRPIAGESAVRVWREHVSGRLVLSASKTGESFKLDPYRISFS